MTKRWIISGVTVVALLGATVGVAHGAGSGGSPSIAPGVGGMLVACEAMHDSPWMQAMHDHMPAALQAKCDAMHEQMAGMMSGSGMMGTSIAEHHSSTTGWNQP